MDWRMTVRLLLDVVAFIAAIVFVLRAARVVKLSVIIGALGSIALLLGGYQVQVHSGWRQQVQIDLVYVLVVVALLGRTHGDLSRLAPDSALKTPGPQRASSREGVQLNLLDGTMIVAGSFLLHWLLLPEWTAFRD